MAEILENGKLFTFNELRILLFACGIREVEGVYMPDKKLTEEEIIYALHHMSEHGMIEAKETKFQIQEEIKTILRIMGNPENTYVWTPNEEEYFCYAASEGIVVSTRYWRKKETIKLRLFSREMFERWKGQIENDYCGC